MRQRKQQLYSIPVGNIDVLIYGYTDLTLRDIENIRRAVDLMEETVLINAEIDAEENIARMQDRVETEGMRDENNSRH